MMPHTKLATNMCTSQEIGTHRIIAPSNPTIPEAPSSSRSPFQTLASSRSCGPTTACKAPKEPSSILCVNLRILISLWTRALIHELTLILALARFPKWQLFWPISNLKTWLSSIALALPMIIVLVRQPRMVQRTASLLTLSLMLLDPSTLSPQSPCPNACKRLVSWRLPVTKSSMSDHNLWFHLNFFVNHTDLMFFTQL